MDSLRLFLELFPSTLVIHPTIRAVFRDFREIFRRSGPKTARATFNAFADWTIDRRSPTNRRLGLECLESRAMLAGDLGSSLAEGEAAPDLVGFAKALSQANVRLLGADWSANTTQQKSLFDDGVNYLNFVEISLANRSGANDTGVVEGITDINTPVWKLANGTRLDGIQTLAQLSTATGIAIPQSSTPSMVPIGNQTVARLSPLHIPVDAYDPNGNPLTVTVSSSNPSVVEATVLQNNQSVRIRVEGYGDMVLEFFNEEAFRPVSRFTTLAQSGFYNTTATTQMKFHRVAPGFVIQGGDPLGNGTGGSTLGTFSDQFDLDLQHNRSGVLSYAHSGDDTNDSQFFITAGPTRSLDFNHSIFGQLVEGDRVRQGIERVPVTNATSGATAFPIVINSTEIFNDTENGLVRLRALGAAGSTADITVTVTDTEGNQVSQVFTVTVADDSFNGNPFLNDVPAPQGFVNQPTVIQLSSQDKEGDVAPFAWGIPNDETVAYTGSINPTTGRLELIAPQDFVGVFDVLVGVRQGNNLFDTERVRVQINHPMLVTISRPSVLEGGAATTVTVTRQNPDLSQALNVALVASQANQLSIPSSVTIPANQTSVTFEISALDDTIADGSQTISLQAQANLFLANAVLIDVIDNESTNPWHNAVQPANTNRDQVISPVDILVVINLLRRIGTGVLPIPADPTSPTHFLVDTNNDFLVSPIDILIVINTIRRQNSGGEGEGPSSNMDAGLLAYLGDDLTDNELQSNRRNVRRPNAR
jgi:large repetitive protein